MKINILIFKKKVQKVFIKYMKITEKVGNIKNKSDSELQKKAKTKTSKKKKKHTHTHTQKKAFNVHMH